jgi:hypothetical protein
MKEKCMTFVDATNRTKHSKNSKFNHTKLAQANELVGLPKNHVGGLRTQRLTFFSASALLMPTCLQGISFGYLALIFFVTWRQYITYFVQQNGGPSGPLFWWKTDDLG